MHRRNVGRAARLQSCSSVAQNFAPHRAAQAPPSSASRDLAWFIPVPAVAAPARPVPGGGCGWEGQPGNIQQFRGSCRGPLGDLLPPTPVGWKGLLEAVGGPRSRIPEPRFLFFSFPSLGRGLGTHWMDDNVSELKAQRSKIRARGAPLTSHPILVTPPRHI